jgi:hypothetical protein
VEVQDQLLGFQVDLDQADWEPLLLVVLELLVKETTEDKVVPVEAFTAAVAVVVQEQLALLLILVTIIMALGVLG